VSADRTPESITIDLSQINPGIGQRFRGRLPAERDILELAWALGINVDGRPQQKAVRNSWNSRQSPHSTVASLHCVPNALPVAADRG
jgi:hypothetical protein